MSYTTPPSLNPSLKQDLDTLVSVVKANVTAISQKMVERAITSAGIVSVPTISIPPLTRLIENIIIPTTHYWEGTWSDHPSDSGGATMRGVILVTLWSTFDDVLINTGIPAVSNAAINFNNRQPTWKKDKQVGKQVLYALLSDEKIAGLWLYKFLSDKYCRFPLAIMTEDPFLGWFISEGVWGSGAGLFSNGGFDEVARSFGWNGNIGQFPTWCISLGDRTPEFAVKLIERRVQYILDISKPGSKNAVFRTGWLRRLVNDPKYSNVATLVKINETFCLNLKGEYQLSQAELQHLKVKAEIYKTLSIQIPG